MIAAGTNFTARNHNDFPPHPSSPSGHLQHRKPDNCGLAYLTCVAEETKYNRCDYMMEAIVIHCPECETSLDVEEDEVDEGEVLSCPECGTDFEVITINPVELKAVEEKEEYEDDDEEENEDGDYS